MRERHEREIHRVEHQLDGHEHHQWVAPDEHAGRTDGEEHGADDQIRREWHRSLLFPFLRQRRTGAPGLVERRGVWLCDSRRNSCPGSLAVPLVGTGPSRAATCVRVCSGRSARRPSATAPSTAITRTTLVSSKGNAKPWKRAMPNASTLPQVGPVQFTCAERLLAPVTLASVATAPLATAK